MWKNIWPDLYKNDDTGDFVIDINEMVKLGLDEVNVADLQEILPETAEHLSNNELKELIDQEEHKIMKKCKTNF